jgi:predicted transcriptional regulator
MDRIADADTRTETADSGSAAIFEELLADQLELRTMGERLAATGDRLGTDELVDIVRHEPALEALLSGPKDRREIEAELDVSRATSHRLTRWLGEQGMATKVDGRFELTGYGQSVAEELLRFERNVVTSARLAPLLESVCSDHQEFVLEPFADATVTTATPDDPYRPVNRFVSLARESATLRGFNTTHMIPLGMNAVAGQLLEASETEVIYLPTVIETLFETYPERAAEAVEQGHLRLRTREELPYGLAIFDDRVGIGGYDEQTGAMTVFVDSDAAMAREWAERVYAVYRERSEPLDG